MNITRQIKTKIIIVSFTVISLSLFHNNPLFSKSAYTLESSEKLKESGKIKWQEYDAFAFNEAALKNKPIFLVITAPTWCFWCHAYLSEDYVYNKVLYPYINKNFIPIYVHADKRQDITRQYLEGGWPSTVVLTPNKERIFGFSGPVPPENLLVTLKKVVGLTKSQAPSERFSLSYKKERIKIPKEDELKKFIDGYFKSASSLFDNEYGGFGKGQKFPQPLTLDSFLEKYEEKKEKIWFDMADKTLRNQYTKISEITFNYNLFDPVEGGFHRYGTKRDWTPPHYEKMLYDNVKLFQAYIHLLKVDPQNEIAKKVVDMTDNFIKKTFYDSKDGGFYGNVDVHGEENYYGKAERPKEKPYVDKTKYTDWNSEAVCSYFSIGKLTGKTEYTRMASRTLDFFIKNILTNEGAYHYIDDNEKKAIRGNLLDNAYLLLALVKGYEHTKDKKYLLPAKKIANYILNNLYDWYSGGFFERNSLEKELYPLSDLIITTKPPEENGIVIYSLSILFKYTKDLRYLNASIKSLGQMLDKAPTLDGGYYYMESVKYVLSNYLLTEFSKNTLELEKIDRKGQEIFWLKSLM